MFDPEDLKITQLEVLRTNHNYKKNCTCEQIHYILDTENHIVRCRDCEAIIDPYVALLNLSKQYKQINQQIQCMQEAAIQLKHYKPWRRGMKDFEKHFNDGTMLPVCPHCHTPFYINELNQWINKMFYPNGVKKTPLVQVQPHYIPENLINQLIQLKGTDIIEGRVVECTEDLLKLFVLDTQKTIEIPIEDISNGVYTKITLIPAPCK